MVYTMHDLEAAREELKRWVDRWANDNSNNPNKYRRERQQAANHVELIELDLKARGIISKTEREKLNEELDKLYPNARSKSVVAHQGKQYQLRYTPRSFGRGLAGSFVSEWEHAWILLDEPA